MNHPPPRPRWLNRPDQREGKKPCLIAPPIVKLLHLNDSLRGLLILGDRLTVTPDISFAQSTQRTHLLQCDHNQACCHESRTCATSVGLHLTHLRTYVCPDRKPKVPPYLHTSIFPTNCKPEYQQGNSKECTESRATLLAYAD